MLRAQVNVADLGRDFMSFHRLLWYKLKVKPFFFGPFDLPIQNETCDCSLQLIYQGLV